MRNYECDFKCVEVLVSVFVGSIHRSVYNVKCGKLGIQILELLAADFKGRPADAQWRSRPLPPLRAPPCRTARRT